MKATITVDMNNAAFEAQPATELARLLVNLAKRITAGKAIDYAPMMDLNGNKVGEFLLEQD